VPRIVDHDAQRRQLLEGAFELFAERSYASVSMRQLASSLGVSTGTLYHYFQGKEDIFEQMLVWLSRRDVLRATADMTVDSGKAERVAVLFDFLGSNADYLSKLLSVALEFQRRRDDPEARELIRSTAAYYREALAEELGIEDPTLVSVVYSLLIGMIVHGALEPAAADRSAQQQLLVQLEVLLG